MSALFHMLFNTRMMFSKHLGLMIFFNTWYFIYIMFSVGVLFMNQIGTSLQKYISSVTKVFTGQQNYTFKLFFIRFFQGFCYFTRNFQDWMLYVYGLSSQLALHCLLWWHMSYHLSGWILTWHDQLERQFLYHFVDLTTAGDWIRPSWCAVAQKVWVSCGIC